MGDVTMGEMPCHRLRRMGTPLRALGHRWSGVAALAALCLSLALPAPGAPALLRPALPTCAGLQTTPPQAEGPYYRPNSPERSSLLEPGMPGVRLTLAGYVLVRPCRPVARAWLDFWQADDRGQYDLAGYRLRGHTYTDAAGVYVLETILPGVYPGRTRHVHVKVRAPGGPTLTTQLYFPGEAGNQTDRIFHPALLVALQDAPAGRVGIFHFLLEGP